MKRYLGWALRIAILYLLLLGAYFIFAFASMNNETLAFYERKLNPSTYVFWQDGEFFSNPPLFSSLMVDTTSQLSQREPIDLAEVDIWVLLLEGFQEIQAVDFAPQLGIDAAQVAKTKAGNSISLEGVSLHFRFHPIPLTVERKHILVLDAKSLRENYEEVCLDEIVYNMMIGQRDQALRERCKMN